MNKQQQIEEMANIPHKCIKSSCEGCIKIDRKCAYYKQAEAIYNAGYRKADEVRKETAKEILKRGKYCMPSGLRDWIKEHYGLEVEE